MNEAYKFNLKRSCIARGWKYENCDIGVKINGVKIDTLKELDDYVQANT
jgi:hypothetical protein